MQRFICGLLVLALAMAGAQAAGKLTLVKDGKPACAIIIAEKASENAAFAANELQQYVKKISGAELPIYLDSQKIMHYGPLVLVGRSQYTDMLGLKIPDGVSPSLREEGYLIRCAGDRLVLAGNDTAPYYGTRYAVDDLLGRLGVRWFLPGDYGEVVPKTATIAVDEINITEQPDFPMRSFWTHSRTEQMGKDRELWMIRNRLNPRSPYWFGVPSDGSLAEYLPKEKIKDYPDWFALQPSGSRNPNLPCMTDELRRNDPQFAGQPRILDEVLKKVGENVHKGGRVSSMAPDDGIPACDCENCRKLSIRYTDGYMADRDAGGPAPEYLTSQEWFFFVDKLLEATAQHYPGHLISTNGYANRVFPPEVSPTFNRQQNLTVMFADILGCTIHGYGDPKCWQTREQYNMLKQWCKISDKVWVYGYNYTMLVTKGTLTPMTRRVRSTVPMTKAAGSIGFFDQEEADMSMLGIPTYVARLALEWDTEANVDAILADFYAKWFGPAAKPMQDYYNPLETAFDKAPFHGHEDVILTSIYTPKVMARLESDIQQAEKAAVTGTEKQHVRAEALIFEHLQCFVEAEKAKREYQFAHAATLMQRMLEIKKELHAITPYFGWRPYPVYQEAWEAERMTRLAGLAAGGLIPLPEAARFATDKQDVGRSQRWMEPDYNDARWQTCRTTTGWQNQGLRDDDGLPLMSKDGHAYRGYAWYRYTVNTSGPEWRRVAGKTHLFLPSAVNQAWVWVNGQYAGRSNYMQAWFRPAEVDLDITPYLKPGNNTIAIRVLCTEDYFGANGLYERPFIYRK
ncbi:MAG: DUF4838 domain-containing protein [Armatimonadota bacterium]